MDVMNGHILAAPGAGERDPMVLVLATDGINARVTSGGLTQTRTVPVDDLKVPEPRLSGHPSPLMRRLAYSIAGAPKRFEEKDQEVRKYYDLAQDLEGKIRDIRKWMILTHEDGTLSREDLDTFLSEFDMEPYRKRWTGTVTITVSLSVDDARNKDAAEDQAYAWAETLIEDSDNEEISSAGISRMTYNLVEDLT